MSGTLLRTIAFFAMISAATAAAAAPKPQLLKRHGIVYGVRGIDPFLDCKGVDPLALCRAYSLAGTIGSVEYYMDTQRISGFMLRTRSGRREMQNVDPWDLPLGAYSLIRPGRRIRVRGTIMGMGHVETPSEIIAEQPR
ncbi:MAG: hypothetical protein QOH81_971 [Sphingomonadales bacterium]|nr:hypothetical protein [Sphingomonadales bacterium]